MKNEEVILINDFYHPPVENLTVAIDHLKTNMLLVYPAFVRPEINSLTDFKGSISYLGKKLTSDDELKKGLKDLIFIDSEIDTKYLERPIYSQFLEAFLDSNNHFKELYLEKIKASSTDLEKLKQEKLKHIEKINNKYANIESKIEEQSQYELAEIRKLFKKNKEPSDVDSFKYQDDLKQAFEKKSKKIAEVEKKKKDEISKVEETYDPKINSYSTDYQKIESRVYKELKKEYKRLKKELNKNIKNVLESDEDVQLKDEKIESLKNDFYSKTYLDRKEAKIRLNKYLTYLGFEPNLLFKFKAFSNFTYLEKTKLKYLLGILTNKRFFVLDLLSPSLNYPDQKELISLLSLALKQNKETLIISNNVDNIQYLVDDSRVFVAIESKTIEYGFKNEILNNPMVPICKKLINKEDITQEDLDLTLELKGKLVSIIPDHYILASETQIIAYKRLLKYEQKMEKKVKQLKEEKAQEEENNIVTQTIMEAVGEEKRVKKVEKLYKNNKQDKIKVYIIEKREKDNMWVIHIENSSKILKLFKTQHEAINYAKKLSLSQAITIKVKSSKGDSFGKYKVI